MIGNSRLHWAWFQDDLVVKTWDTPHLSSLVEPEQLPEAFLAQSYIKQGLTPIPVYLASVVPGQSKMWQNYQQLYFISLQDIKLKNIYPSLGLDRALAVWGAVTTYKRACLVIDGGTALTFTGVDELGQLQGGAILPGLNSQLLTLEQKGAQLPTINLPKTLPPRWGLNTQDAIASGIIYTAIAGMISYIVDWELQFPNSQIVLTGGDAQLLSLYLNLQSPLMAKNTLVEQNLIFWGIKKIYQNRIVI